jgi:uncharacterized small protein (DUF1192 family)
MRLPEGWREQAPGKWFDAARDARGVIHRNGTPHFAMVEAPDRSSKSEAEADLERMVWALEGEDIAMVRADRDRALIRADLSDKALDYARREIADLRAEINRMEARERRRHPVIRKIAHALFVLRGVK